MTWQINIFDFCHPTLLGNHLENIWCGLQTYTPFFFLLAVIGRGNFLDSTNFLQIAVFKWILGENCALDSVSMDLILKFNLCRMGKKHQKLFWITISCATAIYVGVTCRWHWYFPGFKVSVLSKSPLKFRWTRFHSTVISKEFG